MLEYPESRLTEPSPGTTPKKHPTCPRAFSKHPEPGAAAASQPSPVAGGSCQRYDPTGIPEGMASSQLAARASWASHVPSKGFVGDRQTPLAAGGSGKATEPLPHPTCPGSSPAPAPFLDRPWSPV